ncbi:PTS sugar transporter subunit IIA [Geobacter sp. SVR]|uniref:PTS sugar transporter subunit IIA n=1 Tax=Geobacter sp. SVR TaxID=2495594 RepID=UPI00143EFEDA|nr:PTS sugar transporter [Geobacter sp. SVR]BCS53471.1 PTS sugar transporter [Geobacter sp. SVR]GCF85402.1 PTS sugar transporter [Geobacter sp. SVR]
MTGLVLVTHEGLAGALLKSAEMIVGPIECCEQVEVAPQERAEGIMGRVVAAVEKASADGAIIMTDLFGGTPSNMAMSFLKDGQVEVLTGVNLPMVIDFCSKRERMGVGELATELQKCGREGIINAGEFLR